MTTTPEFEPEEAWEAGVQAMLAGLPQIEPPPGFIAGAIDRRPLHAGRITAGLFSLAGLVLVALVAVGVDGRGLVVPEVDQFAGEHLAAEASLLAGGVDNPDEESGSPDSSEQGPGLAGIEAALFTPHGFVRATGSGVDELRQAVYSADGDAVSVFVQPGSVDWSALPAHGEHRVIGSAPAWVDEGRELAVVQVGDETVTLVGLSGRELADVLDRLPAGGQSLYQRALGVAATLTAQLGFPRPGS